MHLHANSFPHLGEHRTGETRAGVAEDRLRQTSQTEDERAAEAMCSGAASHFCLNWQTAIHDKASPDQGANQRLPGVRVLVGEDDDEDAVHSKSCMAPPKHSMPYHLQSSSLTRLYRPPKRLESSISSPSPAS